MSLKDALAGHTNTTKGILVTLMGWAGASQLPGVQKVIKPLLANHPHLDTIVWSLTAIGFLLLTPRAQARIKAKYGIDLTAEQQRLEQSKQNIQQVQDDMKKASHQADESLKKDDEHHA